MSKPLKAWLVVMSVMIVAYGAYKFGRARTQEPNAQESSAQAPSEPRPARPLADFELTERSGKQVRLENMHGKVWAASFFFASCPATCLKMNQSIAKLHAEFAPLGVQFVSLTVDPKNDTPERLRSYVGKLGIEGDASTWMFLTGDFQDIADLGQGVFKVTVSPKTHTERIVLIDRQGKVVGTYNALEPIDVAAFKKKVRELTADATAPGSHENSSRDSDPREKGAAT